MYNDKWKPTPIPIQWRKLPDKWQVAEVAAWLVVVTFLTLLVYVLKTGGN